MRDGQEFPPTLHARLSLLETCLSHINDIILVTAAEPLDEPGPHIVYVNDAFTRLTGYTREEAIGRSPRFLQGPATDRGILDLVRAQMERWQASRCELVNYTRDGHEFWIELDIVPVADDTGRYSHWISIGRDITDRKLAATVIAASERMAQATLDALPSPVCVLDENGVVRATNRAWREFSRRNEGSPLKTDEGANHLATCESFAAALPPEFEHHELVTRLRAILNGDIDHFEISYSCHSPLAAQWFEGRYTRFPGDGPRRVAVVHLDVTSFKQAELREAAQARVMSLLANDAPLSAVLDAIVLGVEAENPAMLCAVHLLDAASGLLRYAAGPSLPRVYREAVAELAPGPRAGSCGTAVWRGERVIAEDIARDPNWERWAEPALNAGLRACWSEPLRDSGDHVLGTFAIYHRAPRSPGAEDFKLIAAAARFVAVAIERRRNEDALRESEVRFANAFEFAAVGVALRAPDGHWMKLNHAFCEMLGYDEQELLTRALERLVHLEDRARLQPLLVQIAAGDIERCQLELRLLHRHGRVVSTMLSLSTVHGADGRPLYHVCQVQDVSALKTAENERDMLFELSPDMLCVAYIDGRFKQVNPAWTRTLGWTREELLEPAYSSFVHPDDLPATLAAGQALREGRPVLGFENRYRCRNDGYRLLSWNAMPLPDVGVVFAVARDVTERVAAEAAQRAADQRAGERQRLEALGGLAGGIAHDFNNLLAVMLGNVALARRASQLDVVRDKLAQIDVAGQRAVELVRQILTFSRRQPQQLKLVSLGEVVADTLRLLRATIPAGIAVEIRIEPQLPPVLADVTQVNQIVMNLCTNAWHALQASARCDPRIEIDVFAGTEALATTSSGTVRPTHCVCLSVRDNGIGMDEATRARVFEPFFTTRTVGEGTGLGLSVVHGIVSAHHGLITVDSAPGQGTTVRVSLPVGRAAEAVTDANAMPAAAARYADSDPPQLRVLYVDDESQLVTLAEELLAQDGHVVTGHADAAAALAALRADPQAYDLVVTDYNMAQFSGFAIARELREVRPDLPVIVASGNITPAMREEARALGIRELLSKPDIASHLRRLVREVMERK